MIDIITSLNELVITLLTAPNDRFWGIVGLLAFALFVYAYTRQKSE